MSQSIDWSYWLKLPEVKVFEAIALMFDTEPGSEPPDIDDASPDYRKTLRLLVACLSDRSTFTPGTLVMGIPALHGVRLPEVGAWAFANDYQLPEKFPRLVKLGSSQPRNTPELPAIDWQFWKAMVSVKLWQACALVVSIEPDTLRQHPQAWMAGPGRGPIFDERTFPNKQIKDRFEKAMRLAETAVSYMDGPIFPQGTPRPGSKLELDVLLSEVAIFFRSIEWTDFPAPMQSIAIPPASATTNAPIEVEVPPPVAAIPKQRKQEKRIIELLKEQGYSPLSLEQRAAGKPGPKAEIRTLAMNEPALFTAKTFDTAWERLRGNGEIVGAE